MKFPEEAFGYNNKQGHPRGGIKVRLLCWHLSSEGLSALYASLCPLVMDGDPKLWAGPIWVRGLFEFKR